MYVIIDIGSNTVRMAVYNIEKDNSFNQIMSNKVSCGLAGYIEDDEMNAEGIEVMIDALKQFRIAVDGMAHVTVFAIATASLRELSNRDAVIKRIKDEIGFEVNVISGKEEALYDYYGITKDIGEATGMLTDCGAEVRRCRFLQVIRLYLRIPCLLGLSTHTTIMSKVFSRLRRNCVTLRRIPRVC